jgi:hypothetical protein
MSRIADIAEGLELRHRRALLNARPNSVGDLIIPTYRDMGRLAKELHGMKLTNAAGRLNKTGQAVATYLKERSHDH